jgi:hypothetical protein
MDKFLDRPLWAMAINICHLYLVRWHMIAIVMFFSLATCTNTPSGPSQGF